ncbi:unnamed protein product, partial [Tenebrio molitor]
SFGVIIATIRTTDSKHYKLKIRVTNSELLRHHVLHFLEAPSMDRVCEKTRSQREDGPDGQNRRKHDPPLRLHRPEPRDFLRRHHLQDVQLVPNPRVRRGQVVQRARRRRV